MGSKNSRLKARGIVVQEEEDAKYARERRLRQERMNHLKRQSEIYVVNEPRLSSAAQRKRVRAAIIIQKYVRKYLQRRDYRKLCKRTHIAKEVLSTEKTYVEGLGVLTHLFRPALVELVLHEKKIKIDEDTLDTLFSNAAQLHALHVKMLAALEDRLNHWHAAQQVGNIFMSTSGFLDAYTDYVVGYSAALEALKLCESIASVRTVLKKCSAQTPTRQGLESHLILPIQRIPRYVLFLKDLVSYTPHGHPDARNLLVARNGMMGLAKLVNERKRDAEVQESKIEFLANVRPALQLHDKRLLATGSCHLLRSEYSLDYNLAMAGLISPLTPSQLQKEVFVKLAARQYFIFENVLLLCKKKKNGFGSVEICLPRLDLSVVSLQDMNHVVLSPGTGFTRAHTPGMTVPLEEKKINFRLRVSSRITKLDLERVSDFILSFENENARKQFVEGIEGTRKTVYRKKETKARQQGGADMLDQLKMDAKKKDKKLSTSSDLADRSGRSSISAKLRHQLFPSSKPSAAAAATHHQEASATQPAAGSKLESFGTFSGSSYRASMPVKRVNRSKTFTVGSEPRSRAQTLQKANPSSDPPAKPLPSPTNPAKPSLRHRPPPQVPSRGRGRGRGGFRNGGPGNTGVAAARGSTSPPPPKPNHMKSTQQTVKNSPRKPLPMPPPDAHASEKTGSKEEENGTAEETAISFSGWLYKKNHNDHHWNKRWFYISGNQLCYAYQPHGTCQRTFGLVPAVVCNVESGYRRDAVFSITGLIDQREGQENTKEVNLVLGADTDENVVVWVKSIVAAAYT